MRLLFLKTFKFSLVFVLFLQRKDGETSAEQIKLDAKEKDVDKTLNNMKKGQNEQKQE